MDFNLLQKSKHLNIERRCHVDIWRSIEFDLINKIISNNEQTSPYFISNKTKNTIQII